MIKAKAKTSPLRHSVHKEKQIKSINRNGAETKKKAKNRKSKDFITEGAEQNKKLPQSHKDTKKCKSINYKVREVSKNFYLIGTKDTQKIF